MRVVTPAQRACLAEAMVAGYEVLRRGGSALDSVVETIRALESSGIFNAGVGSRLQLDGVKRMDASLMEGRTLKAGAVAAIEQVRHPISAARLVMEKTSHVLLVGAHATRFARHFKLGRQPHPTRRKAARRKHRPKSLQRQTVRLYEDIYEAIERRETVGAVALDLRGNVAAGASTGGIDHMLPGRVGDSPLIGCGVYADNEAGAVSMTGVGESIIRIAVAKEIVDRLAAGASPATATRLTLDKLVRRIAGAAAGALVLAPDGRFAVRHTTDRMCAGWWTGIGKPVVGDLFK
jgi:beta-aspartyl-peptidase (threonine type)